MAEEQKHNIMTAESLKKLQERYDYLLNVKRKEIINAIEIARGFGDLSENAEYTEARNDQAKNEAEITRLKALIENARSPSTASWARARTKPTPTKAAFPANPRLALPCWARLSAILWMWKFRAARCTCVLWTSIADLSDFRIGLVRRRFHLCGRDKGA